MVILASHNTPNRKHDNNGDGPSIIHRPSGKKNKLVEEEVQSEDSTEDEDDPLVRADANG